MKGLLAAELLKLRRRVMPRILLLILLLILSLIFWGVAHRSNAATRDQILIPNGWLFSLFYAAFMASFLAPVLGGSWAGSEYGWGTIRMVLSRRPDRAMFVLAGLVVLLLAGAAALLATLVVATAAGWLVGTVNGGHVLASDGIGSNDVEVLLKLFGAAWFVVAFYMVLAYSAGTLFRSGAVGIGIGIGLSLADRVLSGILYALGGSWRTVATHFPDVYARALPTRIVGEGIRNFTDMPRDMPTIPESIIALAIYTAVPLILALVLVRYRDVTA